MAEMLAESRWWWDVVLPRLVLVAACVAVYGGTLDVPFVFDDKQALIGNPHLQRLWPLSEPLTTIDDTALAGRPISSLSLAVNYAISGLEPWSYHVGNLLLHAANAVLALGLLERLLAGRREALRFVAPVLRALAWATVLVWTVHPLNTEAVVYTIQRTELLVSFFLLATMATASRSFDADSARIRWAWGAAAVACCALGMGTKEVMVGAPLLVLLYERARLGEAWVSVLRRGWVLFALLAATWVTLVALVATDPRGDSTGTGHGVSPLQYLYTQSGVIAWYLRLAVWPWPLTIQYHWPIAHSPIETLPWGLVVAGLFALAAWGVWKNRLIGFTWAWFFVILAPSSSVVPIITEVAAERRMYLPLLAVVGTAVVGGGWALGRWARKPMRARPIVAGAMALAVVAGLVSLLRLRDWRSEEAIWAAVARVQPDSAASLSNRGVMLVEQGRFAEAVAVFDRALRIDVSQPTLYLNRGIALASLGRLAEAEADFQEAIRRKPELVEPYLNYAALLANHGQTEAAAGVLREALVHRPGDERVLEMLRSLEPSGPSEAVPGVP